MAKRKRKGSHRRRRVGGVGSGWIMEAAGIVAGAAAAGIVAAKFLPNLDPKIKAAAVVGVGALLVPKFLKGAMGKAVGSGMIAAGGVALLNSFGVLSGIGGIDDGGVMASIGEGDDLSVIAGDDGSVMAGNDDLAVLAGMEDEENY